MAIELNINDLKELEKKSRHIIYGYKDILRNVLRYNVGGIIVPTYIEKELRETLKKMRDNDNKSQYIDLGNNGDLVGEKQRKAWIFKNGNKILHSIKDSGDTYLHTGNQGLGLYKYGKISLENGDIDEEQYLTDLIRNEWHDLNEHITDDIPPFDKNEKYRQWEKETEKKLIENENKLTDREKKFLLKVLDYNKDSRFKTYEYLFVIKDAIEMKKNIDKYNEVLSVIYEVLKFNLPRFEGNLVLDNGEKVEILRLSGIREFFVENLDNIDDLFHFVKDKKEDLFKNHRFKNNKYDKTDLEENFDDFYNTWLQIKTKIKQLEKQTKEIQVKGLEN